MASLGVLLKGRTSDLNFLSFLIKLNQYYFVTFYSVLILKMDNNSNSRLIASRNYLHKSYIANLEICTNRVTKLSI